MSDPFPCCFENVSHGAVIGAANDAAVLDLAGFCRPGQLGIRSWAADGQWFTDELRPDFLPVVRKKNLSAGNPPRLCNGCKPEQLVIRYSVVCLPLRHGGRFDVGEISHHRGAA